MERQQTMNKCSILKEVTAHCEWCGLEFMQKHRAHRFCSPLCCHAKWRFRGKRRSPQETVACLCCGVRFVRTNPKRDYCSPKCRARAHGRRHVKNDADRRRGRDWARQHRQANRIRERDSARRNPERRRATAHRRRARVVSAKGFWTQDEWLALVAACWSACAYCARFVALTVDHRVPLKRGGSNWVWNLLPACLPCNRRKGSRTEREYKEEIRSEKTAQTATEWELTEGPFGYGVPATMGWRGAAQPL
jgi:5-methylcytosine-specific restriction endonuclease McrA